MGHEVGGLVLGHGPGHRLHTAIGYVLPIKHEQAYYRQNNPVHRRCRENSPVTEAGTVHLVIEPWTEGASGGGGALGLLTVTGNYPVLVWSAFVVVGLSIGRTDLVAGRMRLRLLVGGTVAALLGYVALPLVGGQVGAGVYQYQQPPADVVDPLTGAAIEVPWRSLAAPVGNLWWPEPHSGTPAEVFGTGGLVLAVLGVLLVAGPGLRLVLYPLAALGSMPLTAYCVQLVALAVVGPTMQRPDGGLAPLLGFVVAALVMATAVRLLLGRGPLERLISAVCRRATSISVT